MTFAFSKEFAFFLRPTSRFFFMCAIVTLEMTAFGQGQVAPEKPPLQSSFVLLQIAKKEVDADTPWRYLPVQVEKYLGSVILNPKDHKKYILVTANAVFNAQMIEMRKFDENISYSLHVHFVDYEANLALLDSEKPADFDDLLPMEIGKNIKLNQKVTLLSAENSSTLGQTPGRLASIAILPPKTSDYPLTTYQLKIEKTTVGWSDPVISGSTIVGLCSGKKDDMTLVIPSFVIRHFVYDQWDKNYRGFPGLGFQTQDLISPHIRAALNLKSLNRGIRISRVDEGSPFFSKLQENDVLLAIADKTLSHEGTFRHALWGEVEYPVFINSLYGGDEIELSIFRAGAKISISGVLPVHNSNERLIPFYDPLGKEDHVIFAGLVFQELTRNYLATWGKDWNLSAKSDFLYLWQYRNEITRANTKRMVILNRVLPDEINRGYEDLTNLMVDQVNGVNINSLKDLRDALQHPIERFGKAFAQIQFLRGKGEAILGYEGIEIAHKRIVKNYGITTQKGAY